MGWLIPLLAYLFIGLIVTTVAVTIMAYLDWKDDNFSGEFSNHFDDYFDSIGLFGIVVVVWPVVIVSTVVYGIVWCVRWIVVSLVTWLVERNTEQW